MNTFEGSFGEAPAEEEGGNEAEETPPEFESPETMAAEAAELLEDEGGLTVEEQERLVDIVVEGEDAQLAVDVLSLCAERGRELTEDQKERLIEKLLSDLDIAAAHYENLACSDVELTDEEEDLVRRMREALDEAGYFDEADEEGNDADDGDGR